MQGLEIFLNSNDVSDSWLFDKSEFCIVEHLVELQLLPKSKKCCNRVCNLYIKQINEYGRYILNFQCNKCRANSSIYS